MKYFASLLWFTLLIYASHSSAQCGDLVCNGNTGLYSNDDANSIAYDNMGSSFHASYVREPNGSWRVWGAQMSKTSGDVLSPASVTVGNYPALTGTIYKIAVGSDYTNQQLIVLTATGLFAIGDSGYVLSSTITTNSGFHKITVNGKSDGLPVNITPADVKMLFASTATLMITTCSGEVHVLSQYAAMMGNVIPGLSTQWSQVMQNATTPLTNVIVSRGNSNFGYALKADGTIWTWGVNSYLGNGTAALTRTYATQMTLPAGIPAIKMIQATSDGGIGNTYYLLGTDKKVYSLGKNSYGQLGDRTSLDRSSWVNAKNPDNTVITDAAWISSNEHDENFPGLAIIKAGGIFYTAGNNGFYMVGRTIDDGINFLAFPAGIVATDVITHAEQGGHSTAVVRLGSIRYGYVGHRIKGSMGDGSITDQSQPSFDFITPPIVAVCGTICVTPTLTANGPICPGSNAVFTISGNAGDIVSYSLNGGGTQTIAIGAGGSVAVTVIGAQTSQNIQLTYILGATGSCSNTLAITATVVSGILPIFTQVPPICIGDPLSPLPINSNNGVTGSWSPAIDNTQTTTYTFTPVSGGCTAQATMAIAAFSPNTIPTFTQVSGICLGQTLTALPTISNNGVTGSWSPAINSLQTTTYTFTPSTLSACVLNTTMTISVTPGPPPLFTQVQPICDGAVLNALPLVSSNGVSGTWTPALNNHLTTTYTFIPNAGSCSAQSSMTIVVNQKTNPTFTQLVPICTGSPLPTLPLSSNNLISGTWAPPMNNTATTTYTFTPVSTACANTAQMTLVVIPKVLPLFAPVNPLCFADPTFTFPTTSDNNITGTWSPALSNTHSATYTFTPATNECALTTSMHLNILDDFDFEIIKYCEQGNFILGTLPILQSFDPGTASYIWNFNGSTVRTDILFNLTSYLASTAIVEPLPHILTAIVTDSNGCSKTKSIQIDFVYCDIQKGISPNNDGFNEFFDLRLLEVNHLSIFNRYGVKVYSQENYYDQWHGQTDSDTILPDATYYYLIDFKRGPAKTGWIYINNER